MGIDVSTTISKGWIIDNQTYHEVYEKYPLQIETLIDSHFLWCLDHYTDNSEYFLGVVCLYSEYNDYYPLKDLDADSNEKNYVIKIAKKYFNISSPPELYLVSEVY